MFVKVINRLSNLKKKEEIKKEEVKDTELSLLKEIRDELKKNDKKVTTKTTSKKKKD